jgi:hypothetical protein
VKLIKLIVLFFAGAFISMGAIAQSNATLNMLTLNSGDVIINGGAGTLQVTVGNTGPSAAIATGKLNVSISVPSSISIATTQSGLNGWNVTNNSGSVINLCNQSFTIPLNGASTFTIVLQGGAVATAGVIAGQISFKTNCTAPGSLAGDLPADNSGSAGFQVVAGAACNINGATASAGTIACNAGTTTLTVAATTSGTTGTLEYSINGTTYQPSNSFTVPAGTYTALVREAANTACNGTATALTVTEPTAVVASGSVTTPIATIGGTGSITVSAAGGLAGAITYAIVSGTTVNTTGAATGVFTGLLAGTYTFTATKAGCTSAASAGVVLSDPAACIITGVTAAAGTITCNGGTTTLTATATPAGTYQYSLNGGAFQSGNTFTVSGGTYTVVAREAANTGCTATSSVVTVVNPSAVTATAAVSTTIAIPGGTGAITVTGAGGTGAKTYVITGGTTINTTGAANGIFTGLLAGSYTFTATDANGCTGVSAALVLANPGIATADPAVGGMYFTTTTGGVQNANTLLLAPSTAVYDINIPFFNLNQANPVPAGTINFTINLGKKLVLAPGFNLAAAPLSTYFTWTSAVVGGNVIITGTQSLTTAIPADFNGIATFRVKGDSACSSNVVSNIVITNALQTLSDDDLNNNAATLQYSLPITLSNTQVNVTCNGAGNGRINVTVSSGTTVVTTGPSGYTNTQNIASGVNTFSLTNLAPGTYTITATAPSDAPLTSCSSVNTVIISQPTVLTIPGAGVSHTNNNCFNAADGTITVTAAGGTAPYVYTIAGPTVNTTGALNGVFTGLTAGTYTVTVTDNNSCSATTASIIITQPVGGIPDITLGSDYTGNLFTTPGVTQTIVYNIAEINGNSAVGDTLRITKVAGFTINFNPTLFTTTVGGTTYALDNTRWKIDNSDPAFVSIILTDPLVPANPGTLLCNQLVRVSVTLTRNTSDISTFPLSARLRRANGETNLANNLNSIVFTAE